MASDIQGLLVIWVAVKVPGEGESRSGQTASSLKGNRARLSSSGCMDKERKGCWITINNAQIFHLMVAETWTGTRMHGDVSTLRNQWAEEEASLQVTGGLFNVGLRACNLHENSLNGRFSSLTRCQMDGSAGREAAWETPAPAALWPDFKSPDRWWRRSSAAQSLGCSSISEAVNSFWLQETAAGRKKSDN